MLAVSYAPAQQAEATVTNLRGTDRLTTELRDQFSFAATQPFAEVALLGYNDEVTTPAETLWLGGGTLTYPSSAVQLKVSSTSANDTSAGSGARTIFIDGLGADYVPLRETVTLNGTTAATTSGSFLRVNSVRVKTSGDLGVAAGTIWLGTGTVTAGVPAVKHATVRAGDTQAYLGSFTTPAGSMAYLLETSFTQWGSPGASTASIWVDPDGESASTLWSGPLSGVAQAFRVNVSDLEVSEKTDIQLRAVNLRGNTAETIGRLSFLLVYE
jgi:hypothetical protein